MRNHDVSFRFNSVDVIYNVNSDSADLLPDLGEQPPESWKNPQKTTQTERGSQGTHVRTALNHRTFVRKSEHPGSRTDKRGNR